MRISTFLIVIGFVELAATVSSAESAPILSKRIKPLKIASRALSPAQIACEHELNRNITSLLVQRLKREIDLENLDPKLMDVRAVQAKTQSWVLAQSLFKESGYDSLAFHSDEVVIVTRRLILALKMMTEKSTSNSSQKAINCDNSMLTNGTVFLEYLLTNTDYEQVKDHETPQDRISRAIKIEAFLLAESVLKDIRDKGAVGDAVIMHYRKYLLAYKVLIENDSIVAKRNLIR